MPVFEPPVLAEEPEPERVFRPDWPVNRILHGDCLDLLTSVPSASIHLVLCDLPYGTTVNPWDSVIPLDALWAHYHRVLKPEGVVVLTSQGPFTAVLIVSNLAWFRYKLVWVKSKATNFLNAKHQPLRRHEDVCVFSPSKHRYAPQMQPGEQYDKGVRKAQLTGSYGTFSPVQVASKGERYPTDVLYFKTAEAEGPVLHPTQKPVALGRYLVRTYSRPGEVVLDNACGSGSFLVAAKLEGRNWLGIERGTDALKFKGEPMDVLTLARERLAEAMPGARQRTWLVGSA